MAEYQFHVYSVRELPLSIRHFPLPGYPFSGEDNTLPDNVREFFVNHGIVFYRDELNPYGILCDPDDDDDTPIYGRSGWLGYRSSGIFDSVIGTMIRWSKQNPAKYRKVIRNKSDDYAWHQWNIPKNVLEMTEESVTAT